MANFSRKQQFFSNFHIDNNHLRPDCPVIPIRPTAAPTYKKSMYKAFFKRTIDIFGAFFGLCILALPMLIIALIVRFSSRGPVIFATQRLGKNRKPFMFYKFRSMRTDTPKDCPTHLLDSEKYITRIGKFLRKTSLDELPQLWNILKGDMSIVGPRPCFESETDLVMERELNKVFSIRPGLTGLAQVTGRDLLASSFKRKAYVDGVYVEKLSFWLDVKIIFKTFVQVLCRRDIKEGDKKN